MLRSTHYVPLSSALSQQPLNHLLQLLHTDRFGEVLVEACFHASSDILLHPEPAERDRLELAPFGLDRPHQIEAAAVGQTDIADHQIELPGAHLLEGAADRIGRADLVAAAFQ